MRRAGEAGAIGCKQQDVVIARFTKIERLGAAGVCVAGRFLRLQAKLVVMAEEREIEARPVDVFTGERAVGRLALGNGGGVGGVEERDVGAAGCNAERRDWVIADRGAATAS